MTKPHGNTGNRHAAKPQSEKATSGFSGRCRPAEKASWVKAAQLAGLKLVPWMVSRLNAAAKAEQSRR